MVELTDLNYMVTKTRTHGRKLEMNGKMLASMFDNELGKNLKISIGYGKELHVDTRNKTIAYVDTNTHEETILDYIIMQER